MHIDARDHGFALEFEAQVLIIGAGPVGLTLAEELSATMNVLLVESGGFGRDTDTEELSIGDVIGLPYPLEQTRTRQVGGSFSLWAGWLAPFDDTDFSPSAVSHLGCWPFGADELAPYIEKAAHKLNLHDLCFDARSLANNCDVEPGLDTHNVKPGAWRIGEPTRRYKSFDRDLLRNNKNIVLITHANATDIRLDANLEKVQHVEIRTLNGRKGVVSGETVILACGGLETVRLLLNSNSDTRDGVSNSSGLVGRCFMEHPHVTFATVTKQGSDLLAGSIRPNKDRHGRTFMFNYGINAELRENLGIRNGRMHVFRSPEMGAADYSNVGVFFEQSPNIDSCVHLSQERDRLGSRKLVLDWRLCDDDWRTFELAGKIFMDELSAVISEKKFNDAGHRHRRVLHSNHHLGVTRMCLNSGGGVVDENCRSHDLSNLYMMSGGVFPTVSWANPTLTVIAMTYRLIFHLRSRFEGLKDSKFRGISSRKDS